MISGSISVSNQDKSLTVGSTSIGKRIPGVQDDFNGVAYNKMVDESKHTEDGDISRFESSDNVNETDRNLKRLSQLSQSPNDDTIGQNLDIRSRRASGIHYESQEIKDDQEADGRNNSKNKQQKMKGTSQSKANTQIYTIDYEEQKTHDQLNQDSHYDSHRLNTEDNCHIKKVNYAGQNFKPKIATFSMKAHLPQIKMNIPLAISGNDVFQIFTSICKAQRFQVIEMDQNIATAVNKEPFSFTKILQRCLPFSDLRRDQQSDSLISAVRLQIRVNDVKCCRKVSLKGLYGDNDKLQEFLALFKNKLHSDVQALPNEKKSLQRNDISDDNPKTKERKKHMSKIQYSYQRTKGMMVDSDDDSDSDIRNGAFNETSSIYQIHKILSSDQYTLGKNVAEYIECFHLQYKSLRESASMLPQPMEGIMSLIQETVHSFQSEYNLGKETAKTLMNYCRPQVEKYLFSKLYDKLFAMYAIKNEEEDKLFIERSSQIKIIKAHEVMQYLGIKQQFIIGENNSAKIKRSRAANYEQSSDKIFEDPIKDLSNSQYESYRSEATFNIVNNHFNNTSTSSIGGLSTIGKLDLPYNEAIKCIEKIQQFQSPREKLLCLSESFGCLKTSIVDHWKGKLELDSMDDTLPLTIYVVSMAELSHPASELNIMEDYLAMYDKGFDFERKLLTNFDVSIRYINHEWELQLNNQ